MNIGNAARITGLPAKITELKAMRTTFGHLIKSRAGGHRPDCPIREDRAVVPHNESG
ncbi:MAG: hypothetical protein ACU0C8_07075 [Roseovarius sp.]